jgi:hypothetical protein
MDAKGTHCESCGMTIEAGPYCQYCTDENGELQDFDERFARMVQFMMRRDTSLTREQAEVRTREYMATMPAWRNHPGITG